MVDHAADFDAARDHTIAADIALVLVGGRRPAGRGVGQEHLLLGIPHGQGEVGSIGEERVSLGHEVGAVDIEARVGWAALGHAVEPSLDGFLVGES